MFNKVILIGNLTRDPELRYTPAGIPIARFTLAVNQPRSKNKEGAVDFINCVAWRRLAEIVGEYLKKGRPAAVEGRLQIRTYEKDGEKRTMAEVVVDNMQMLGRRPESAAGPAAETVTEESSRTAEVPEAEEVRVAPDGEEIPF